LDKKKPSHAHAIATYSTIGIQLAATVVIFILGGYKLDDYLNRSPVYTSIGALLGMIIGFYHLIKQLKHFDDEGKKDKK
jgi:F0F1-type ATP synthase assembly protein I